MVIKIPEPRIKAPSSKKLFLRGKGGSVRRTIGWLYEPREDGKGGWVLGEPKGKIVKYEKTLMYLWERIRKQKDRRRRRRERKLQEKAKKMGIKIIVKDYPTAMERIPEESLYRNYV